MMRLFTLFSTFLSIDITPKTITNKLLNNNKNLDHNLQYDSYLKTSYQNNNLSKQRNSKVRFS